MINVTPNSKGQVSLSSIVTAVLAQETTKPVLVRTFIKAFKSSLLAGAFKGFSLNERFVLPVVIKSRENGEAQIVKHKEYAVEWNTETEAVIQKIADESKADRVRNSSKASRPLQLTFAQLDTVDFDAQELNTRTVQFLDSSRKKGLKMASLRNEGVTPVDASTVVASPLLVTPKTKSVRIPISQ